MLDRRVAWHIFPRAVHPQAEGLPNSRQALRLKVPPSDGWLVGGLWVPEHGVRTVGQNGDVEIAAGGDEIVDGDLGALARVAGAQDGRQ